MVNKFPAVALLAGLLLMVACGNADAPAREGGGAMTSPPAEVQARYASVEPELREIDGVTQVVLKVVEETTGVVVFEAIGSDPYDPSEAGTIEWTPMRDGLLVQVRAAMEALGWTEVTEGPEWYAVRFQGDSSARVATTEAPYDPSATAAPPSAQPEPPDPTSTDATMSDEVSTLLALLGKSFDDPEMQRYVMTCGYGTDGSDFSGDVECVQRGFRIEMGSEMTAFQITLYNDEGDGGYAQFPGPLPSGLAWGDGYDAILTKMGPPVQVTGGDGFEVGLDYLVDGLSLQIQLDATQDDPAALASAHMHSIMLSRPGA